MGNPALQPCPEHVFVDPAAGFIDFGDAYRSHPAMDLRPWRQPGDTADLLAGYRSGGPLPNGFEEVLTACHIMAELSQVARGTRDVAAAAARIRELDSAA
jgi:hygromycin-B 7''-O-kinase